MSSAHHLRFAAALALVSSTAMAGCYQAHERREIARAGDAAREDAATPDTGPRTCTSPLPCTCPSLGTSGNCDAVGLSRCCPVVGPLAPPDLPIG